MSLARHNPLEFQQTLFFEWSFLHLLLDQGNDWIAALTATGEPPALGRVVELLSQATYPIADQWPRELHALERAQVRPQWLRAWLVAPVFSPRFAEHSDMFAVALAENGRRLFEKLLVWMQAEKTTPNPIVLSGALGGELDANARIHLADSLGWPSDFAAWRRLLIWVLDQLESIPDAHVHNVVSLFETWQVAVASVPNAVSQRIVKLCATWVQVVEDERAERSSARTRSDRAGELARRFAGRIEKEARALLLGSARAFPDDVDAYLARSSTSRLWPDRVFREVIAFAPMLAQSHPVQLAQASQRWFKRELPDELAARWRQEEIEEAAWRAAVAAKPQQERSRKDRLALPPASILSRWFTDHHWDDLSIGADHQGFFPASPLREPFHSLLAHHQATGLALIRDVVNHATTAWRQLHRHFADSPTPLPITLEFPWGRQEFWGDDLHYQWFRGHGGPQVVECALMAAEAWAIAQLEAGSAVDDVLRHLLEGHTSIGVLGIAVHLALRAREASATTLALLRSLRLMKLDLTRKVKESGLGNAGLMGFGGKADEKEHRKKVIDSNQLLSRRLELRDLVPLFVLGKDVALRDECRRALDEFPTRLEFAFEEDSKDARLVAEMRQAAELWRELGHIENYTAQRAPGRTDVIHVSVTSPRHEAADIQEAQQRHANAALEMELWLWVEKCFEARAWVPTYSPDEAFGRARALEHAVAERSTMSFAQGSGFAEGAIAGTAAAMLCYADTNPHDAWTDATIESYRVAQDEISDDTFSGAMIPWHPKIFVAHALAARIRSAREYPTDREALYRLIAHPIEAVSVAALSGVASCWQRDARFAWCGLNLGLRLAQLVSRRDMHRLETEARRQVESDHRAATMAAALDEYCAPALLPAWVRPRPSWVRAAPVAENLRRPVEGEDEGWRRTDDVWDCKHAANVLQRVPVAAVMKSVGRAQFVDALEAFVDWTLDTINPAWRTEQRQGRERGDGNLYEWEDQLGRMAAGIAPHLRADEILRRLLRPILAQPDDIAMRLLAPFTVSLVCGEVLDAPTVRKDTLVLLQVVLDRAVKCDELRRSEHNNGRIGGFDLPKLIDSLLFVIVKHAPGAARFANGVWDDLPCVMPLIDGMVRAVGWHPYVARQFVTLCERSSAAYPTEAFADQVLAQIVEGRLPDSWRRTSVPASIAALVQMHADRLHPLPAGLASKLLRVLDALVDLGDRRSAALQQSESFRGVRRESAS